MALLSNYYFEGSQPFEFGWFCQSPDLTSHSLQAMDFGFSFRVYQAKKNPSIFRQKGISRMESTSYYLMIGLISMLR